MRFVNLNFKPWKGSEEMECTICSCGVAEDTFHFFAIFCPALSELRQLHLRRSYLSPEALDWANGKHWGRLASYCEDAYKKRESLV
jgi:hypothetical protein